MCVSSTRSASNRHTARMPRGGTPADPVCIAVHASRPHMSGWQCQRGRTQCARACPNHCTVGTVNCPNASAVARLIPKINRADSLLVRAVDAARLNKTGANSSARGRGKTSSEIGESFSCRLPAAMDAHRCSSRKPASTSEMGIPASRLCISSGNRPSCCPKTETEGVVPAGFRASSIRIDSSRRLSS